MSPRYEGKPRLAGKPRDVGIDAAIGEFVFFCDNDDCFGEEALERLYDFAKHNHSDIVIGKIAGINRAVRLRSLSSRRSHRPGWSTLP